MEIFFLKEKVLIIIISGIPRVVKDNNLLVLNAIRSVMQSRNATNFMAIPLDIDFTRNHFNQL